jgi:transcriptional regulator with XRE-family HTH domain
MEISPEQIRAARALLRLEQAELAKRAGASVVTVRRLESARGRERVAPSILGKVRTVLEQAGAEFIPDGVRRRRAGRPDAATLYEDLRAISLRSAARLKDRELLLTDADLYDEDGLPA